MRSFVQYLYQILYVSNFDMYFQLVELYFQILLTYFQEKRFDSTRFLR